MRKSSSGHAAQAIERVLELSADAQITRQRTPKDSPAFHSLNGAIAAYGKTLALLIALQQREDSTQCSREVSFPSAMRLS